MDLELATKAKLAETARTIARSYQLVQCGNITFMPMDYESGALGPTDPTHQVWMPLSRREKRKMGNEFGNVLFATDSELTNFDLMLQQFSIDTNTSPDALLLRTPDGLKQLRQDGSLSDPTGVFIANYLQPELNTDDARKDEVFSTITNWLQSEDDAHSLLNHFSTALSPGWSAVKYVLLIGAGRNGKSVLMSMMHDLFGHGNVSHVTRQQIADRLPVCVELNSKLLNIVFDGQMAYIKDSSMEKTLIAGEPGHVRMLYENGNTTVQTNALFVEALNSEPKSRDKSSALQKRLSRFFFPNRYSLDQSFERHMRQPEMLGALLALLLDHFVKSEDLAVKLQQTPRAAELEAEQMLLNSPALQFVDYLVNSDSAWIGRLEGSDVTLDSMVGSFMAWRIQEGHTEYSSADAARLFRECFLTKRKSAREGGKVTKKEVLIGPREVMQNFLDILKGDPSGLHTEALVED